LRSASTTRPCTSHTDCTALGEGEGDVGGVGGVGAGALAGGDAKGALLAVVPESGVLVSLFPCIFAAPVWFTGGAGCAPVSGDAEVASCTSSPSVDC
jgi:hypothetical protein